MALEIPRSRPRYEAPEAQSELHRVHSLREYAQDMEGVLGVSIFSKAVISMVIDHSGCLHECVYDSRSDEAHSSLFEIFG